MPRRLRIHLPGGFYHVTLRGNHQKNIFHVDSDRRLLNTIVARCLERYVARLHAYCWMSNHLHLLVQVSDEPLSSPMRQIASEFARAMQIKMETTGHLFERRYHATLVDADSYLLELVRYIHLNPVRAGIVRDAGEFAWSSHHVYLGLRTEPWVSTGFVMSMFSSDGARAHGAYRAFLRCQPAQDLESRLTAAQDRVGILGSEQFIARVKNASGGGTVRQSLDSLIGEACDRFGVERATLDSSVRDVYLTKVRAWIANQAVQRKIATLAAVARTLCRNESTLREAIQKYPLEVE